MFFFENPEASRRLAAAIDAASQLSLFQGDQRVQAASAAQRATSWDTLPQWLLDIVEQVEGGPSFEVIPGDPMSQVVIHVPHSSTYIPAWVHERIHLSLDQLRRELKLMTDVRTDEIAERAAESAAVRPWIFVNRRSRLVVDPERFPDPDDEPMAAPGIGMGAVYTRTADGDILRDDDPEHREALLDRYFRPYAAAITELVQERLDTLGAVTIIDLHSYPVLELSYESLHHPGVVRPECCVGVDSIHTPPALGDAAIAAFSRLGEVRENEPFAGTYVPLKFYSVDDRVKSVMIELRRDTYLEQPPGIPVPAWLLTNLIDTVNAQP